MVPRIAQQGHSFKGAAMYYLHDKKADTNERVAWTHIHNIPAQDPKKAMLWMAYTSMNADRLKKQAGVVSTGRKNTSGDVYSYSLAWHPEQNPEKKVMLEEALKTLTILRLDDHEAVMVAHIDTDHPHVHVICNLIHPENGKKAQVSFDRLTLSKYAENLEKEDGKIHCEQRVINNAKRLNQAEHGRQIKLIKHREQKLARAAFIQEQYNSTTDIEVFKDALAKEGYAMAQGQRRGYVLVDTKGEVFALSRQLKGQRAKDIKARFGNSDYLPRADVLSKERKENNQQNKGESKEQSGQKQRGAKENKEAKREVYNESHLRKLDALRGWERRSKEKRVQLELRQEKYYKRKSMIAEIKALEEALGLEKEKRMSSAKRTKDLENQLVEIQKNLENTQMRIKEQRDALEKEVRAQRPIENQAQSQGSDSAKSQRLEQIRKRKKDKYQGRGKSRGR